ncbi:DUF1775 domain-containing protein [Micromonospora sp. LOL_023]|uniref:DUF1775 domain-containing protein n=1 Tax=Micromonospora sp. LOL_023 TaxID=3345418 RepID=UPI003A8779F7
MVSGLGTGALRVGTVLFGAVMALTLAAAPAAAADIVLEPPQAPRGSGIMLTFQLPEERPGAYTTQVRLDLPADLPIAEVYPMSVDDWAPRIASRPLAEPLPGLHGGVMTEATESIVWQRVTAAPASAPPVRLSVSVGPLPDADRVDFAVTQAYSDGTEVRWGGLDAQRPAPSLVLSAADPAAAAAGHGAHSGGGQASGDQGTSGPAAASADNAGTGMGLLLAGLAGGALLGAAAVWWQARRRAGATVEPADAAEPGPLVGAGSASSGKQWRLTER